MDKYVEDILSKSQYGQKRSDILSKFSMDKYVKDILSKSQYGLRWTKTQMISLVNLSMDKNVDDILSKSQYGQKRR